MNPLKCSYVAFLVLLCLGFSFGHRILLDTKNNNDAEQKNQTHDNKDMDQTHGVGVGFGSGSNGGAGIGIGIGGGSNQKCHGEPCQQQPCPIEGPCQGQGGVTIPGFEIPPIQIPGVNIPLPIPQFPFPTQPTPCPPKNCRPDPCPPQNCMQGSCPPFDCQPCVQEKNMTATATEFKKMERDQNEFNKTDVRNHEVAAETGNTDKDYHDSVDAKPQSTKSYEEARQAEVHH